MAFGSLRQNQFIKIMDMKRKVFFVAMVQLFISVASFAQYIPMDYSTCGYRASESKIPDVRNVVYVQCKSGDNSQRIQKAIDYVASLPIGRDGFRGSVLLGKGEFQIDEPLWIKVSGIVLRGVDEKGTILTKHGVDRGALIYIEGGNDLKITDTLKIVNAKVQAGSTSISLATPSDKIRKGDLVRIFRPSTKAWIASIGCNIFGGGLDNLGWKPGDIDIQWDRQVVGIEGAKITFDSPITTALDQHWGGGKVFLYKWNGRIQNCGVENLTLNSTYDSTNAKDEDHCWVGVTIENARNCWVRRSQFFHFAGNAVIVQNTASCVTVEDCLCDEPVSELGGFRRCSFYTRGQQTLVQRCISRHGIHDFAAGYCAPGPNAFVQCEAEETNGYSGSIGSWAAGLLFDVVNIDGGNISYKNLGQSKYGAGWNTANSMLWQCTAAELECYSPSPEDKNSANACWGSFSGNGEWKDSNNHVKPFSLFYAQLYRRLGKNAPDGYILPRDENDASSSPTIEGAKRFAYETLTEPRLTMEMWEDSIPYNASVSSNGLKDVDNIKIKYPNISSAKVNHKYAIVNGKLNMDGQLLVGNNYDVPWWTGNIKDRFLPHAKVDVTRFVPGREGLGLTDRLDSVINYMKDNHYLILNHNYGLWYDLRRDDHERIRRSDGDVWPPFYEQPFARSGKGMAWDGLSKYDLNKYNEWYWKRLKDFAYKASQNGLLLFHENYFQHNIYEAGAHWVDSPWRPVNNINNTDFPEPVPFIGDKRQFMGIFFYNEKDSTLRKFHINYIRQCLNNFADNQNVIQLISAEYTGPLHFTQFWIDVIADWEKKTGKHPLIALSTTKDVQDSILADPVRSKIIDIIDIRYWHYKTDGMFAPPGGSSMAPRQFMRKMKVGKTTYYEAYKAVNEYRSKYPDKAVMFFAQNYPELGWGIFMAGGSCPDLPVTDTEFLKDAACMNVEETGITTYQKIGKSDKGCIIYSHEAQTINVALNAGKYEICEIQPSSGKMNVMGKNIKINGQYNLRTSSKETVYWIHRL